MSGAIEVGTGPSRREIGLGGLAVFSVVASLLALAWSLRSPLRDPTQAVITVYGSLMFTFVGVVVLWRRPRHGIGRLAVVIGLLFSLSAAITSALEWWQPGSGVRLVLFGPLKTIYELLDTFSSLLALAGLVLGVVLMITWFPDGRRTSRLGGLVELALVSGVVAVTVAPGPIDLGGVAGAENPIGVPFVDDGVAWSVTNFMALAYAASFGLSIVVVVRRYRRAGAVTRVQIRWVAAAALLPLVFIPLLFVGPGWIWSTWFISTAAMPIAIGIAILRYRLYDIDRLVGRTLAYAVVTACSH